jgi:hypothetical protein
LFLQSTSTPAEQEAAPPPGTQDNFTGAVTAGTVNTFTDGEPSATALELLEPTRLTTRSITLVNRGPFFIPGARKVLYDLRPHYLLVDEDLKIIPPQHQHALTRLSLIPGVQPERRPAKAVYRINIAFTPKNPKRGTPGLFVQGTAIHLGNSVFITCAHTLQWP